MLDTLQGVHFITPTIGVLVAAALACLLLLLSGYASGSEIAFFSLSPKDIAALEAQRSKVDKSIEMLRKDSERTLATILISNNFVNVMIIMLCNYIFANTVDFGGALWLQFLIITILLTFCLLLFGEIMPKVFARSQPLKFCRRIAGGICFMRRLTWPMASLLMRSGVIAGKLIHKDNHVLSVDELEKALMLTDKKEIIEDENMLKGIIRFSDETAKEIMTSRKDIVDLSIKSTFRDVLRCIVENNYSRIPVYGKDTDDIRGVLYIKDLLLHINKGASFRWQSLIRPPYFVPETKKIDDLLREFQSNKVHIAIVVDEFGGIGGMVTLEDILEEIVGEINDEYDEEEKPYTKVNRNTYVFEGKTLLSDFCRILSLQDDEFQDIEGEADTLAGLLLELKGDFPKMHECFNHKRYTFEIMALDERRIAKVKVVIHD